MYNYIYINRSKWHCWTITTSRINNN